MTDPVCGIVMPISPMEDCTAQHWADVKDIISDAISSAGYEPRLVSTAAEVDIIQKRIIQNLYQNPVVVCDVSCKNANVMFELGLRLAFDKPTIVIKDDKTGYSFDTSPIEHLEYPRSLRHGLINKFKQDLIDKIKATAKAKEDNPEFSPFLKSFGPFKAASIETREVPAQELMMDMMQSVLNKIDRLELTTAPSIQSRISAFHRFPIPKLNDNEINAILRNLSESFINQKIVHEETRSGSFIKVSGNKLSEKDQQLISEFIRDILMERVSVSVNKLDSEEP